MAGGKDANWIVAGLVGAILLPVLVIVAGLSFLIAAPIAVVVFVALVLLLGRRVPAGSRPATGGEAAFARRLIADAEGTADRLRSAANLIEDKLVKEKVTRLSRVTDDVLAKLDETPANAGAVQRFLGYYLPRAAEVAEGYMSLENRHTPDRDRLDEVSVVIGKLEGAFVHYADSLADAELGMLDADLRLIQASLKEDLGR